MKQMVHNIPDLTGLVAIVTGASSGIGQGTASALARAGATTILAVRNEAKGNSIKADILRQYPHASLDVMIVDLADLKSVRSFSERALQTYPRIDRLVNNAGIGMLPQRQFTKDGFELLFGTNFFGHFALTGLLLPALLAAPESRVVTVCSLAHRFGRLDFDNLNSERKYNGNAAYGQSKLANMLFALELDRRAKAAAVPLVSVAAHPGFARTAFLYSGGGSQRAIAIKEKLFGWMIQNADLGARSPVHAAAHPAVSGGQFWGPSYLAETRGPPKPAKIAKRALDEEAAKRLWEIGERATGVKIELPVR